MKIINWKELLTENLINKELSYQCCFCGQGIESTHLDPSTLNVLINFDKEKEKQYDQDFYCHLACFKQTLQQDVPFFLEHLGYVSN